MQCYGHPVHWKEADNFKKHMNELRPLIKTQISPFNAKYIRECIKFCKRWERELTANDRENTKYIRYLHSEINRELVLQNDFFSNFLVIQLYSFVVF